MIAARLAWEDEAAPLIEQLQRFAVAPNAKELAVLSAEPPLDAFLAAALHMFRELGTCRQLGWSVGPIPVTAIDTYVDRRVDRGLLDPSVADLMKQTLLCTDGEWLRALHAKQPKPEPPTTKGKRR